MVTLCPLVFRICFDMVLAVSARLSASHLHGKITSHTYKISSPSNRHEKPWSCQLHAALAWANARVVSLPSLACGDISRIVFRWLLKQSGFETRVQSATSGLEKSSSARPQNPQTTKVNFRIYNRGVVWLNEFNARGQTRTLSRRTNLRPYPGHWSWVLVVIGSSS